MGLDIMPRRLLRLRLCLMLLRLRRSRGMRGCLDTITRRDLAIIGELDTGRLGRILGRTGWVLAITDTAIIRDIGAGKDAISI